MTELSVRQRLNLLSLERADTPGQLRTAGLGVLAASGELLGAVDHAGCLHLLVPAEHGKRLRTDLRSRGVGVRPLELPGAHDSQLFVDLHCRQVTQNYVFEALAADVVAEITASPDDASSIPYRLLERWRQVFQRPPGSDMPRKQLVGLLGELIFLREMLLIFEDMSLDVWTGPANQRHDFSGAMASLEVKTTEVSTSRIVEIHGLEQLQAKHDGVLFLGHARVESHPDGQSAADLIAELSELSGDSASLYAKLEQARYVDSPSAHERFVVRELAVFEVVGDFPKLVLSMLSGGEVPQGVTGVSYNVDLGAVGPALGLDSQRAALGQVAGLQP